MTDRKQMSKRQANLIRAEIVRLMRVAESGAQWAEICRLEKLLVDAGYKA